jgi:hypothetical protein
MVPGGKEVLKVSFPLIEGNDTFFSPLQKTITK